jgi:hypothetical protein
MQQSSNEATSPVDDSQDDELIQEELQKPDPQTEYVLDEPEGLTSPMKDCLNDS